MASMMTNNVNRFANGGVVAGRSAVANGGAVASRGASACRKLLMLLAAFALALGMLPVGASVAWADEEEKDPLAEMVAAQPATGSDESDGNLVRPQQLPDSSFIYDTPLIDLAGADSFYDKQTVQVVGEAVGDILEEDFGSTHRWVTLYAEDNKVTATLAVYMKESDTHLIKKLGAYSRVGTMLQVRGVFHLACPEHAGVSDLHAENVTVMDKGYQDRDTFKPMAFVPGLVLVIVGAGLMLLFHFMREKQR